MSELVDFRMQETLDKSNDLSKQLNESINALDNQTNQIIDGAVDANLRKIGFWNKATLYICIYWPPIIIAISAAIAALFSSMVGNKNAYYIMLIPCILKIIEILTSSHFIQKKLLSVALPLVKKCIKNRIMKTAREVETDFLDTITQRVLKEHPLLQKCYQIIQ